ncbi:uncharacterized protein LOC105446340 [Strongylocentrotus purpuratus]|uniref:Uncharacterized protein n=1 Tax=Strongylocentrotus purpuratus TaxID=7668 RepID=A0A7M7HJ31_STRPU|nr:uncharacterized protein LOC105446340 [Strongylocentrotus purpuratus]|eukprot:XP_011681325.1 PREDICTED: uncharacterized protein LOC105446340 [Strongylocentrotus purpuratus]
MASHCGQAFGIKMKVTVFLLCLALAVVLGHVYGIDEELEEYMLEDMLDDDDHDLGDVEIQNWFKKAFNKVKKAGKTIGNGIKKGVQSGCGMVNSIPSKELTYRMSVAFPELISEDVEDGYYETADIKKLANDVRKACGMIG